MICKRIFVIGLGIILFLCTLALLIGGVRDNYVSSQSVFGLIIMFMLLIVIIKMPADRLEIRSIFTYEIPKIMFVIGSVLLLIGLLQILGSLFVEFVMNDILLFSTIIGMAMMVVAKYLDFFIIQHKYKKDSEE